jgi:hypothetical protein
MFKNVPFANNDNKLLTLQAKNNYGAIALYPHCEQAKLLARLAGTKTITSHSLSLIKQLGYSVNVLPPELPSYCIGWDGI